MSLFCIIFIIYYRTKRWLVIFINLTYNIVHNMHSMQGRIQPFLRGFPTQEKGSNHMSPFKCIHFQHCLIDPASNTAYLGLNFTSKYKHRRVLCRGKSIRIPNYYIPNSLHSFCSHFYKKALFSKILLNVF